MPVALVICCNVVRGQTLREPVQQFYSLCARAQFWYGGDSRQAGIRNRFRQLIDSAAWYGLDRARYRLPVDSASRSDNSTRQEQVDKQFTEAVIGWSRDVYMGYIDSRVSNDEVSGKFLRTDFDTIVRRLGAIKTIDDVNAYIDFLQHNDSVALTLKACLAQNLNGGNRLKATQIAATLNLHQWIRHFNFEKHIVVYIPSATLQLYENGVKRSKMNVVVGKQSTRTPRFATWCDKVILYPYWNVPRSIAVNELLPKFKRSIAAVNDMNMQILDRSGRLVDPYSLNWAAFNRSNFPYSIRQCTGCDNSLGVIKFNLTDPFSVYLHDTNNKLAFLSGNRYFSHGCIRVSDPLGLGNFILENKLDSNFLKACMKDQKPVIIDLKARIPVFVVYMTAEASGDSVVYYKDIYKLFKN
jgi:hypothetical protein